MKPRTELERRVAKLRVTLPEITEKQKLHASDKCFDHFAFFTKTSISCMECGHQWPSKGTPSVEYCRCPKCGRKLKMEESRKIKIEDRAYYGIATVRGEFQVLRYFLVCRHCRVGLTAHTHLWETVQHWIHSSGKLLVVARSANMGSNGWRGSSDLELRNALTYGSIDSKYRIWPTAFSPRSKLLDVIKRNGVKSLNHDISPWSLILATLTDSRAETLLKAGYVDLLRFNLSSGLISRYWDSFKICMRSGYIITDGSMWADYIGLLRYFNKDIRNAKYVCPTNLKEEHDRLEAKKRKLEADRRAKLDAEAKLKREERDKQLQKEFKRRIAKFAELQLKEGAIEIVVLKSIADFKAEGDTLKHCVYTHDYFKRDDALVLSARIDNTPVETIELSLKTMQIVQCRGKHNQSTEYHDQIINIVNNNINQIERLKNGKKKLRPSATGVA